MYPNALWHGAFVAAFGSIVAVPPPILVFPWTYWRRSFLVLVLVLFLGA